MRHKQHSNGYPLLDDGHSIELLVKLSDVTGSGKSQMVASKLPKMYISGSTQVINKIPTAIPMFSGSNYQMRIVAILYDKTGRNLK